MLNILSAGLFFMHLLSSADFFSKSTFSKIISLPETFLFAPKHTFKGKKRKKTAYNLFYGGWGYVFYVHLPIIRTLDTSK